MIKAVNTGLEREEAIKAIDLNAVEEEGLTMEKVMQEVTMLAKLDHNNIIKVYNKLRTTEEFDYLFVIMELCTSTLVDILKAHSNGVPIKEARNILSQIVDSVAYLHSKKIIHRDLKPANVFIKEGIIKIGDFNISKEIGIHTNESNKQIGFRRGARKTQTELVLDELAKMIDNEKRSNQGAGR